MNDPNNPTMKPTYPWPSPTGNPPAHGDLDEFCNSPNLNRARLLIRDVTVEECSWLPRDFKSGETVYEYDGYCYGIISPSGIACTMVQGETPFYEFPTDSLGPL